MNILKGKTSNGWDGSLAYLEIPTMILKAIDFPGKWEESAPWEGGRCQDLGPGSG